MAVARDDVDAAIAAASAAETVRVVATVIRLTGDWALAEDCAQDALARALVEWPRQGVPANPGAWLTTVAKNVARDRLRRAAIEAAALGRLTVRTELEGGGDPAVALAETPDDDRLSLIFTCCHPALPMEARVALTLRTVAGLATAEIARAFGVSEATMAKRLVRARAKIRDAAIPYRVPPPDLLPERITGVLAVLYLLFNEGYSASGGETLLRSSLALDAIRLSRLLLALLAGSPHETEAMGLLALMLLHHARRAARTDAAGDLVILEDQDRRLWDQAQIGEGVALLQRAQRLDVARATAPGRYRIQAAIAACHARAPDAAGTDFVRVTRLYDALMMIAPSPVVELNRAVAVAMSDGPEAGLRLVDHLDREGALTGEHLLPATRADLLRRLGRMSEAAEAYRHARDLAPSPVERRYLSKRLAQALAAGRVLSRTAGAGTARRSGAPTSP